MLKDSYPLYLANEPVMTDESLEVLDKYSGKMATKVALAGPREIEAAIQAAHDAAPAMAALKSYQRRAVLEHCVARFRERAEELAEALCIEAGKPIKDSRGEVVRLIETFRVAAAEAERIEGRVLSLDNHERAAAYFGMTKRVPIGPVSLITPFNFPLNLTAHKVAPAIAAGCPFVLKPAEKTPIGALIIGEILAETDLPKGAFSVLTCMVENAGPFTKDDRLKLLSFTGSDKVGWMLKGQAGKKKVVLELGGNAACIVDETADIADAAERIVFGAYYQSGQSCISVQRILAHKDIYADLRQALVSKVKNLVAGDPRDEKTFIGPVISKGDGERLKSWIDAAVKGGAKILAGGKRDGVMVDATLLESLPKDCDLYRKEAFGPVAAMEEFADFDEALTRANDSPYGLQAGVFTRDILRAHRAWDRLEVGGVIINDVPSWRVDHMPYGGVKDSGIGREGLTWAIEDMTEVRLMVLRRTDED
ncbi:aldehyde dehydrogenase [Iodidimonas gelatinilytica]|uniref:Aldehyde dehydrogenase n=1 Tax=Iodidimonas gelatinilytica TaxID=1236966 RepID=A0A5A7MQX1_9PROT|nr:aldehyde dehydrogenase [Iodidimonas gelatinilytica]